MENEKAIYQKHLTLQERYTIEDGLNQSLTLKHIAQQTGKDPSTISKEIRRHRIPESSYSPTVNDCIYRKKCQKHNLCMSCQSHMKCSSCRNADCRTLCKEYRSSLCKRTIRAPYVCNGCNAIYECHQPHFFYRANISNDAYVSVLKNSRMGINLTRTQLFELDCLLTPLLKQGQSIAHIYESHKEEIPCTMRTLYSYIDQGIFTARNIDLPKKVKYKPRKKRRQPSQIDTANREGRTYKDFEEYLIKNPDFSIVEMDTVHGKRGSSKVLLTFLFRSCSLMIVFLIEECTQECVTEAFDKLIGMLGVERFKKSFPIILTDNGSEFKGVEALEKTSSGSQRTKIFYCDALASWQKARLEKNHVYIRKIIPKGVSLESYTQEDITLLTNHINSTARTSLNGRTPFELAQLLLDKELLKCMNLELIEPDKVILKPNLLKN